MSLGHAYDVLEVMFFYNYTVHVCNCFDVYLFVFMLMFMSTAIVKPFFVLSIQEVQLQSDVLQYHCVTILQKYKLYR